ncbi:hypothetical protein MicloDRAFT_00015450 [Microvirga lotononidis]|uniref:Uncharacterized protein n=1 Tax=Microvirga lotononidis TaxID=864069 RepID=I4YYN2_9HYPH|nr:hypothetical protein MicloDRAFT_00015450 [Microvirga lotononidis]
MFLCIGEMAHPRAFSGEDARDMPCLPVMAGDDTLDVMAGPVPAIPIR